MKNTYLVWIMALLFPLAACTYSINMVHTEGQADDVVDETSSTPVSTSLSVPAAVL